eukprot:scaffold6658_cov20-Tisochrysis_lutea.AAC.2
MHACTAIKAHLLAPTDSKLHSRTQDATSAAWVRFSLARACSLGVVIDSCSHACLHNMYLISTCILCFPGADRNEGTNALESAVRFGELLRLCAAAGVRDVRLLFCGPGLCISNWEQGSGAVASSFAIAVHAALKKEGASYESSKRAQIQNAHTLSTGEHGGLKCNLRLMPAHLNRGP